MGLRCDPVVHSLQTADGSIVTEKNVISINIYHYALVSFVHPAPPS